MAEGPSHHHLLITHHEHQQQNPSQPRSRGLRTAAGEIVEVQGGHIVRSTGRKDRHSKVCTAKGPRDRRVRLSAHTAIQFYDVQDRLGYDRPSKAVDWLIQNAKAAIDELAELPPWLPTAASTTTAMNQEAMADEAGSSHYEYGGASGRGCSSSGFLPPSLDSDAIADTIKSFFPMAAAAAGDSAATGAAQSSNLAVGFQNYPPDLLSRTSSSQNQDLRLSLQSFQDLNFHHHNAAQQQQQHSHAALFSGFDSAVAPWAVAESSAAGSNAGGYVFSQQQQQQQTMAMQHTVLGQSQFFTQRGPLQSSNQPFNRAWYDLMAAEMHHPAAAVHSAQSIGFASDSGFSGFRIPARIQGEEEHDGMSDKPSSASSVSHH